MHSYHLKVTNLKKLVRPTGMAIWPAIHQVTYLKCLLDRKGETQKLIVLKRPCRLDKHLHQGRAHKFNSQFIINKLKQHTVTWYAYKKKHLSV